MKSDSMRAQRRRATFRAFYYFVLGAAGGATGWYVAAIVSRFVGDVGAVAAVAIQGAVLGSLIGLGSGAFDGLSSRSAARMLKFGGPSLLLGLVAGAVSLPLAQWLYGALGTSSRGGTAMSAALLLKGTLCWMIFGGLIGLGEGVNKGSQVWKGLVGGVIGGFIGGGVYEVFGRTRMTAASSSEEVILAFAIATLGGAVGAAIALVTTMLRGAWLVVESGPLAGTERDISKYVDSRLGSRKAGIIGSSEWDASIYLPGDPDVLARHATISYVDGKPMLTVMPLARSSARTLVNGRAVTEWPLTNGDRIEVGSTNLVYRQRRR